jgi:hypothetical protein
MPPGHNVSSRTDVNERLLSGDRQMINPIEIATMGFALFFYATLIVKQHIAFRVKE